MTEQELLAAEHALGLLEGAALMDARRLVVVDQDFASHVAWWETHFAPLVNAVPGVKPPEQIWANIEERLSNDPTAVVHKLTRKVRVWQGLAGLATAAAAAALLVVVLPSPERARPPTAAPARPPFLVASLSDEEGTTSLSVAYVGQDRALVVSPGRIEQLPDRNHELWVIPAGASPISLGTIRPEGIQRRQVGAAVATRIASGATIAISVEPAGGSPSGQPTGPVLATGMLNPV